jgi:uncharacterized protein YbjT (DUF2867 family)
MRILVTGATGNVGRIVVELLVRAGADVRALTRSPSRASLPDGVEVVGGDLTSPATLGAALRGVSRMYLFPVPETASEVVAEARRAGVKRIVVLSSGAVTVGMDTDFHLPVEQAVARSGLAWTHVRPGEFALNKLWLWGPSIRAERVVRDPFPDLAWCPIHERDVAEVACAALLEDGHEGTAYTMVGPEMISRRDQVRAIAAAIGQDIVFEQVSRSEALAHYRRLGGFAAANAEFLLGFTDYSGETSGHGPPSRRPAGESTLPTAAAVTGRARTFAEWARDHAADFAVLSG